ncbi:nucleosome assembly protein 1-like 1 [Drosophila tropicalis]|uniref:nucleosome assembly protein 1-like 1 n=1 Tax=Drosophila tropicalis TaxID=46794 RepID=UPI0035ABD357
MDTIRARSQAKLKSAMGGSQQLRAEKNDSKFTEDEKKTIGELKQLYLETIKLDVDLQRDIYNMEKSYESRHNEIYDKRKKILDEFRKQNHGDSTTNGSVPNFWVKVLKLSYTEFISKKDESILSYLSDIRSKLFNDPVVKFTIEFHFDKNEYFSNSVLTKTYYLNCLPDPEDPLSYDGAEIYKCEGCTIDWINPKEGDKMVDQSSFFDFFTPPVLPENTEDPIYCDINAILQNDFELGFYLKERVVPKAVIFFTGEIADCQSTDDSESETEESEEDSEVEDEEESSNGTDK